MPLNGRQAPALNEQGLLNSSNGANASSTFTNASMRTKSQIIPKGSTDTLLGEESHQRMLSHEAVGSVDFGRVVCCSVDKYRIFLVRQGFVKNAVLGDRCLCSMGRIRILQFSIFNAFTFSLQPVRWDFPGRRFRLYLLMNLTSRASSGTHHPS